MKDFKEAIVTTSATIREAVEKINVSALQIALVVDDQNKLLGTITDGDIRRYILSYGDFDALVGKIIQINPITGVLADSKEQLLMKMHHFGVSQLPIINEENQVVGLESLDSLLSKNIRDNPVIFMAGGLGKRLYPLTEHCPKPLLKIADKPIIEILLENFIKHGFVNYYFSVNYKRDMIRDYFGSGEKWGVNIQYIEEEGGLGTAGSLSLLSSLPTQPFFVVNSDILTNVNFGHILDFHQNQSREIAATLCVRQQQNVIPYGLVHLDDEHKDLIGIEEKPIRNYFANAGIYVLNPAALKYLQFNQYCDMPDFLTSLVKNGQQVAAFPIREYWLDIGHHENLIKASSDYLEMF